MAKYKLAISIPTYERPDCITDLIDYMIDEAERLNVGIYVFDGSKKNHLKLIRSRDVWSFFEYVKFCSYGNFSVKDLYEYKKYIVQVSNIPWGVMVFLAAMPCWFNHIIREIIRPINRIFRDRLIKNLEISLNKSILIMSINKVKYKVSYNV